MKKYRENGNYLLGLKGHHDHVTKLPENSKLLFSCEISNKNDFFIIDKNIIGS